MYNAIILTNAQVFERYPYNDTKEAMLARDAVTQGCGIAVIQCRFFSRLNNIPFLNDISIEALKEKIPNSEIDIRFIIDTSLLKKNQIVVAFVKN